MKNTVASMPRLGDVMLNAGYLTLEQLKYALKLQADSGSGKRLGEVLIENGLITEDVLLSALSKHLHIKYVSITDEPIDIKTVGLIPKHVAVKYCLIATRTKNGVLMVNTNDPLDYYALEDVKLITQMPIEARVCKKSELINAINESYSEIEAQNAASGANETAIGTTSVTTHIDITESADDTPVVTLINSTLYKAYSAGASDVHIEPFEKTTQVRIRVDGQIVDYLSLSQSLHNSITARIKILAALDIAEKRAPQDGHFRAKLQDIEMNVRVSVLPTVYGEKLVLRFMNQNTALDYADSFGMSHDDYRKMIRLLTVPHGLIYITGPTGSGKTTTLYMITEYLSKRTVNIATIEDPVEKYIPRVNQTQIAPLAGLTFESGLRSILRQDPDIVLIGETRDTETARISVRAALTGHMVLSSLHTNDAVSAIVRLVDMGVEDYLLANSIVGIVAQRLIKKICPFCYEEYRPDEDERRVLGGAQIETLARGAGCHNCNNTGYKGRIAVHEILAVDNNIRSMIAHKSAIEDINAYVRNAGNTKTLTMGISQLVLEKKTTSRELFRNTYFVE